MSLEDYLKAAVEAINAPVAAPEGKDEDGFQVYRGKRPKRLLKKRNAQIIQAKGLPCLFVFLSLAQRPFSKQLVCGLYTLLDVMAWGIDFNTLGGQREGRSYVVTHPFQRRRWHAPNVQQSTGVKLGVAAGRHISIRQYHVLY